jgi:hypothetical protein
MDLKNLERQASRMGNSLLSLELSLLILAHKAAEWRSRDES